MEFQTVMDVNCGAAGSSAGLPRRVTWIGNFVPPYAAPLYRSLTQKLEDFRMLLSTNMETDRHWKPDHSGLNARVQRTFSLTYRWRHPHGFTQPVQLHVP